MKKNFGRGRSVPLPLKELMEKLLKDENLEKPLHRQKAVEYWNDVIEEPLRAETRAVAIKDGRLFVEVSTSILRNELVFRRTELQERLNRRLGEEIVHDLVFINRRTYDR